MIDNNDIYTIIAAYLNGEELSQQEKGRLNTWISNPGNKEKYIYYKNIYESHERLKIWDSIQIPEGWPEKIFEQELNRKLIFRKFINYAAVVIPLMILSLLLVFYTDKNKKENGSIEIATTDFEPGKSKAILRTSEGEEIVLTESGIRINENSKTHIDEKGVIIYDTENISNQYVEYHTLSISRGGEYQLVLPDGSRVWLNSESEITFPNCFIESQRKVVVKGEAYFEVVKNEDMPFIVSVKDCDIHVLGTEFNVTNYNDEDFITTTLVTGKVEFQRQNESKILSPGQQCIFNKTNNSMDLKAVDTYNYTSWKDGIFIFDNIKIKELAKQISRWYNIEIDIINDDVANATFTGALEKYKPVSFIIHLLNETNTVKCELVGNRLKIY